MTGIRRALPPMLLGPFVTTVAIITVTVLVGPNEPLLGGPFMNWLFGVAVYGVLALVQGACMLGFDALFALYTGPVIAGRRCAWIAGLAAPLPVTATWWAAPPGRRDAGTFAIALFAPIVVFAGLVVWVATAACRRRQINRGARRRA